MRTASKLLGVVTGMLAAVALTVPATAAAGADRASTNSVLRQQRRSSGNVQSTNWAGYAVTGGAFTSVTATWTQPVSTCSATTSRSGFWVGLDGDGSTGVEQTGTAAACDAGTLRNFAWYEMYPAPPVEVALTVRPGDQMTGTVTFGTGGFVLTIRNNTLNAVFTTTQQQTSARRYSAEVVAEAPSNVSGSIYPLPSFGSVAFTHALVDAAPIGGYSALEHIDMVSSGVPAMTTAALTGGTDFTVSQPVGPPGPAPGQTTLPPEYPKPLPPPPPFTDPPCCTPGPPSHPAAPPNPAPTPPRIWHRLAV